MILVQSLSASECLNGARRVVRILDEELPGHAADDGEEHEVGRALPEREVAERRGVEVASVREILREERVGAVLRALVRAGAARVLAVPVWDLQRLETIEVALDGELRIEAVAALHVVRVPNVEAVLRGRVDALAVGAAGHLAVGVLRDGRSIGLVAREAARGAVGIVGARRGGAVDVDRREALARRPRHGSVEGRAGELARAGRPAATAEGERIGPGVLFVGQHDHGDERVAAEEVLALLQNRRVEAVEIGLRRVDRGVELDRVVRIRLDEEAVPALELRFETAAVLLGADGQILEVLDEGGNVGLLGDVRIGLALVLRLVRREPREEVAAVVVEGLRVHDRGLGRAAGRLRAADEVTAIVVVAVADGRPRCAAARFADVLRAAAAERRGDDAEVQIVDRRELELPAVGAGQRRGAGGLLALRLVGLVLAVRREQTRHEVRHGLLQEILLVAHRRRVVDREQEVELVDGLLFGGGIPGRRPGLGCHHDVERGAAGDDADSDEQPQPSHSMHWRSTFAPEAGRPSAENAMAWGQSPAALPVT